MPRPHPDEYHEHKTGVKSKKSSSKSSSGVRSLDDYLLDLENQAIDAEYGSGSGGGSSGGGGGGSSGSLNALKSFKETGNKTIGDVYANVQNQMNASADKVAADYAAGTKGAQDAYAPVAPNLNTASQQIQAAQSGTGVAGSSASAALEAQINAGIQAQIQNTISKQATTGAAALATAQNREQGMTAAARQSATSAPFYRDKALSKFNSQIDLDIAKAGASSGGGGGGGGGGSSSREGKAQAKRIRAYEKYLKSKAGKEGKQKSAQDKAKQKILGMSGAKGVIGVSALGGHQDLGERLVNELENSGYKKGDDVSQLLNSIMQDYIYGPEKQDMNQHYENTAPIKLPGVLGDIQRGIGNEKLVTDISEPYRPWVGGNPFNVRAIKNRQKNASQVEEYLNRLLRQYNRGY